MRTLLGSSLPLALAVSGLLAAGPRADAGTVVYDFEDQAATSTFSSRPGALTSLALTTSGLTMTLTRPGSAFDIFNDTLSPGGFPASFGTRSLDPFSGAGSNTAFVANFSAAVSGFSLQFGDFGGDSDTGTIRAYSGLNGTGTLLASATDTYGTQSLPVFDAFGVTATGIESVVFIAGSTTFPNSVYYDNITVTTPSAVPEPASVLLVSTAGVLVLGRRRSRRRIPLAD